jgi:hypothetical protein
MLSQKDLLKEMKVSVVNLDDHSSNKILVLAEEFQLIQMALKVLLMLASMDEPDTSRIEKIKDFIANSVSPMLE